MSEKLQCWHEGWDLESIPEDKFKSEHRRRISLLSKGLSGRPRLCGHQGKYRKSCSYCQEVKARAQKNGNQETD